MDDNNLLNNEKNKYIDKDNYLLNREKKKNKIVFNIILITLIIIFVAITLRVLYIFTKPNRPPYIILVIYVIISLIFYYIYFSLSDIVSIIIKKNILFKI
tara:strand:- start:71 stop:370 length:300 start_codon:yes stop_codon:yes gene_type:complete